MEVGGGDLGGGGVRGELAPFVFIFPPSLAFFGFSPAHLPNKGKNAQIEKSDQRWNK